MQETTLLAYKEIGKELNLRQKRVKEALYRLGAATNTEISHHMSLPINQITPRINELRKKGVVTCINKRKCKITGFTALVWAVTDAEVRRYNLYGQNQHGQAWKGRNA